MKKIMMIFAILLLTGISANAQGKQKIQNNKFFLSLAAGPSFPIGDFGSTSTDNENAGLAKTGFTTNLQFSYQLHKYFGLTSTVLYSYNNLDISQFEQYGVKTDHWQHYGIMAGPMFILPVGEKMNTDFKVLAGITNVNSPSVKFADGTSLLNEEWSTSFAMQLGADFRYNFTDRFYLLTNLDYILMKPKFDNSSPIGDGSQNSYEQKINALNLTVGVGINF